MRTTFWFACLFFGNLFFLFEQSYGGSYSMVQTLSQTYQSANIDSLRDTIFTLTQNNSGDRRDGIFYGDGYRFGIMTPNGWVLDDSSGYSSGQIGRYYPAGLSWDQSKAVMYITTADKNTKGHESLMSLLEDDSVQSRNDAPSIKITRLESLMTSDHKVAVVRSFEFSNHEVVAYVDEKSVVVMLVLSATEESALKAAMPAFQELVGSYFYVPEKIKIKQE
jgi:hypothetical protein